MDICTYDPLLPDGPPQWIVRVSKRWLWDEQDVAITLFGVLEVADCLDLIFFNMDFGTRSGLLVIGEARGRHGVVRETCTTGYEPKEVKKDRRVFWSSKM